MKPITEVPSINWYSCERSKRSITPTLTYPCTDHPCPWQWEKRASFTAPICLLRLITYIACTNLEVFKYDFHEEDQLSYQKSQKFNAAFRNYRPKTLENDYFGQNFTIFVNFGGQNTFSNSLH